jgi:hypothetical protein
MKNAIRTIARLVWSNVSKTGKRLLVRVNLSKGIDHMALNCDDEELRTRRSRHRGNLTRSGFATRVWAQRRPIEDRHSIQYPISTGLFGWRCPDDAVCALRVVWQVSERDTGADLAKSEGALEAASLLPMATPEFFDV